MRLKVLPIRNTAQRHFRNSRVLVLIVIGSIECVDPISVTLEGAMTCQDSGEHGNVVGWQIIPIPR